MTTSEERRSEILKILSTSKEFVTAQKLAERFGVTRQIIVSDVGILRANGNAIAATKNGYRIVKEDDGMMTECVVCRHNAAATMDEFNAVLDFGGAILNVIVEHPIYGQISADLNIESKKDAEAFVIKAKACQASQLCDLTGGLHVHTIKVPSAEAFEKITARLTELGILV